MMKAVEHAGESVAQAPVKAVVPLTAARVVSQRWMGLVEVPPALEHALEQSAAEFTGEHGRQLNSSSRQLLQRLRRNARTSVRGGVHAPPTMDPGSGLRARPKQVQASILAA